MASQSAIQSGHDTYKTEGTIMSGKIEWITTVEAAEIMGVALSTVSRLCREKKLNGEQIGVGTRSVWLVDKASAENYVKTVGGRGHSLDKVDTDTNL